jgi:putative ABC transport system permease protein
MSLRTQITHGFRSLLRRSADHRDVADEVEHYLAEAADAYRAQGLPDAEAERAARLDLGSRTSVQQQVRASRWEASVEAAMVDLRRAARRLRRTPGFATVTILTLGLGIGASTAVFSTVRPVLLDSLPYPDADRVVVVTDIAGTDGTPLDVTFGTYSEVVARSRSIQHAAVSRPWLPTLRGEGEAERLDGLSVSADYFRVLGVAPALGRDFAAADDRPGAKPVVIVSNALWQRLSDDRRAIGRTITLDGAPVTIVGVMPRAFEHVWKPDTRIWRPLGYDAALPADGREWGHHLQMFARLAPGIPLDTARRDLSSIARTPVAAFRRPAWASLSRGFLITPLQEYVSAAALPALRAVMAATILLLFVAAANVITLMLARGAERRGELATCKAFGAPRLRLLTPLLAEGILLGVAGGALGVALAYAMVGTLVTLDGFALPRLDAIRVDRGALAFAVALSTGIGVLAAIIPGLSLTSPSDGLESGSRVVLTHQRLRRAFVAAEVALALVLLVGAGLLVRTVQRLMAVPTGFRAERVLTFQVQAAGPEFRQAEAVFQLFDRLRSAVATVPGVTSVATTSQLPLSGDFDAYGMQSRAEYVVAPAAARQAFRYAVSPRYFETMGIPLVSGRTLDDGDRTDTPPVVVLSASMARRHFGDRSPLGEKIRIGATEDWFTVVGVAGDVRQSALAVSPLEAAYLPAIQWRFPDRAMWIVVHTAADPAAIEPAVRGAIRNVARNRPIVRLATMEQRVAAAAARQRFVMTAFQTFATVALLLAIVGIYGVLSGGVLERTSEIAVRSAVGASRARIMTLILRQAATMVTAGTIAGLAIAVSASRGLSALLFEVSPLDGATYASVAAMLFLAAAIGAVVPAWRASRIPPASALRA